MRLVHEEPLANKPILILGIFLIVLGIIIASIGLIGEIIIFTHGKDFRDYHVARIVEGGRLPAAPRAGHDPDRIVLHSLTAAREGAWERFVAGHEHATLFHGLKWRDMLVSTFKHQPLYTLAMRSGEVVGVLPLISIRSMFMGRSLISVPFGVYGGVLSTEEQATHALCEEARRLSNESNAHYVELRHLHLPPGMGGLPASDLYHTFIKELPDDPAEIVAGLPRKARAEVRKARRHDDIETRVGQLDIETFHRLFALNKRRLGSPPFPKSLFYRILETLADQTLMLSVHKGERPIAAVMSFVFRDSLMAYYSGAIMEANRVSANNLMYAALMEEAVRRGLRTFDFGRSRSGTGAFDFKKNQGFRPQLLHYQYLLGEGQEIPAHNNSNPKYDVARRVFRLLPRFASERVGSYVSKRLPI
jgi:FemAB-related protein (PEP-CTERM system-associated)